MNTSTRKGFRRVMAANDKHPEDRRPYGDGSVDRSAQTGQAPPVAATFGRSGMDDAPPPLPKGWLILGGGLATAVIATAVIVGTGTFSLDAETDPNVPEAMESLVDRDSARADAYSREPVGTAPLTQATGSCLGGARDERNADSTRCVPTSVVRPWPGRLLPASRRARSPTTWSG